MKKIAIVAAVLASALSLLGCNKKAEAGEFTVEKGKFKVGMEIGYPPMEYFDADGKTPMGFDVEFGLCRFGCADP